MNQEFTPEQLSEMALAQGASVEDAEPNPRRSLLEDIRSAQVEQSDREREEELRAVEAEAKRWKHLYRDAMNDLAREREVARLLGHIEETNFEPPSWLPVTAGSDHHATLMFMLSDLHLDERVRPEELGGLNAYDRTIATMRIERVFRNAVKLARHYLTGVQYDGVVLMLGGDTFSGIIHEELKETNEATLFQSMDYYLDPVGAGIEMLAREFGQVFLPCVPGNHGRLTRKPRAKLRASDNLDWFFAKMLARGFRNDPRLDFFIPEAPDAYFKVYDHGQLLSHGDQVNGGFGIGGIWPPIMRMRANKEKRHMSIDQPFRTMWIGHWHQYIATPGMVINGSTKGYDEYANVSNFAFEVPQQALAILTPEHGLSWQCPVFCSRPDEEGWTFRAGNVPLVGAQDDEVGLYVPGARS